MVAYRVAIIRLGGEKKFFRLIPPNNTLFEASNVKF
jgi:hypothetical protein